MIKLEETENTELVQDIDETGNIVLVMTIKTEEEDNNVVTFQFQNRERSQECLNLFDGKSILSVRDIFRNKELHVGCTIGELDRALLFIELVDYDKDGIYPVGAYGFTISPNERGYESIKDIFEMIEREKEEQMRDECKLDNTKYQR